MGDDHILAVENNGFSEDYKRFYFSDIQGIITRKTRRGAVWSIVLACLIASSLAGALFLEREPLRIFFWAFSGVFFAFFLINILRGPTCICHILTAVQEEQLPSLNRLRVARRVIGALRVVIEKTQGVLGPDEVKASESEEVVHPSPSVQRFQKPRNRKQEVRHYDGAIHMIVFALILADGLLTGILVFRHTAIMSGVSSVLTLLWSILIVIALVRQRETDIPGSVRTMTWVSLGFLCLSYFLGYILMITTMVANRQQEFTTQWDFYRAMLNLSPQDFPFRMAVYLFSAACSIALGALGLIRVKKHRDDSARARDSVQYPGREVTV